MITLSRILSILVAYTATVLPFDTLNRVISGHRADLLSTLNDFFTPIVWFFWIGFLMFYLPSMFYCSSGSHLKPLRMATCGLISGLAPTLLVASGALVGDLPPLVPLHTLLLKVAAAGLAASFGWWLSAYVNNAVQYLAPQRRAAQQG
jgi:hypothetical protein